MRDTKKVRIFGEMMIDVPMPIVVGTTMNLELSSNFWIALSLTFVPNATTSALSLAGLQASAEPWSFMDEIFVIWGQTRGWVAWISFVTGRITQ